MEIYCIKKFCIVLITFVILGLKIIFSDLIDKLVGVYIFYYYNGT